MGNNITHKVVQDANIPDGIYDNTWTMRREAWRSNELVDSLPAERITGMDTKWGSRPDIPRQIVNVAELSEPVLMTDANAAKPLDNNTQAVDIKGYRVLTQDEKDRMNQLKELEARLMEVLTDNFESVPNLNARSHFIGKENIQTGFMWAIRAIARPNGE